MYFLSVFKYKKTGENKKNRDFFKRRTLKSSLNDFIVKTVRGLLPLGKERELHILLIYF